MKKIISSILIPTLLFYFYGCYSSREITKEELKNLKDEGDVILLTKEPKKYVLYSDEYDVENDTINVYEGTKRSVVMADSRVIKNGYETAFSGDIALDDVTQLELKEFDTLLTIGSIIIPIGLLIWASKDLPWGPKKGF